MYSFFKIPERSSWEKNTCKSQTLLFFGHCKSSMADGRSICSSDAGAVHVLETEFSSLNPESCELECLHLNDGKLVWMNDLDGSKEIRGKCFKIARKVANAWREYKAI